jgi:GST-like protein
MAFTLYGRPGWGSVLAEAQLDWYGFAYRFETLDDLFQSADARAVLAPVNPIAQIPTLILPDGTVMTESAAITLHLAEIAARDRLTPEIGDPRRPGCLRWLIFIVANIYPTFTYGDDPARFVTVEAARAPFRASIDAYRERLWRVVEQAASQPWFIGEAISAIDIFIAVMTRWEPHRPWFAANCPRLTEIASRADAHARLQGVWRRNFPDAAL